MKKLIYFTLGNNENYLNLAKLCIKSIENTKYDGDFLFITNFKDLILKTIDFKNDVYFMETPNTSLYTSSSNKLKIYDFDKINDYDKIIFSDLDILFIDNPDIIFNEITDDKFYVSNENELMSEEWWGSKIFTDSEKEIINNNKIMGINAGFFAFNRNMVHFMRKIDYFLNENIHLSNECLEQPFFNVYLYRNSLYDNKLSEYISHNGYNLNEFNGVILHFAGGPGNYGVKYDKMINFFNKNIL